MFRLTCGFTVLALALLLASASEAHSINRPDKAIAEGYRLPTAHAPMSRTRTAARTAEMRGDAPPPVTRLRDGALFPSLGEAIVDTDTQDHDTLLLGVGFYEESVVVDRPLAIRGAEQGSILSGRNELVEPAITLAPDVAGIVLDHFVIEGYLASCIRGTRNSDLTITGVEMYECQGTAESAAVDFEGPIDNLHLSGGIIRFAETQGVRVRGGASTNLYFGFNELKQIRGGAGIALEGGTVAGLRIEHNMIEEAATLGISVTGVIPGAGPNVVTYNQIVQPGRVGIEIRVPEGSGLDEGDGAIVVEANDVYRWNGTNPEDNRDLAGIAVIRRAFDPGAGHVDLPVGVSIAHNFVSGFRQPSNSEGFGILVEGVGMRILLNFLQDNDVGIQLQAGHQPYAPGMAVDGDDGDLPDQYFGRGNAPEVCALVGDDNGFVGNGVNLREVVPQGQVARVVALNRTTDRAYCSIQEAIDDEATVAGDTVEILPGLHRENLVLHKALVLRGPYFGYPGYDPGRDGSGEAVLAPTSGSAVLTVTASNAEIVGLTFSGGAGVAIASAPNKGGFANGVEVADTRIMEMGGGGIDIDGAGAEGQGWLLSHNLFADLGPAATAVRIVGAPAPLAIGNHVRDVGQAGMLIAGTSSFAWIMDNRIERTGASGMEIGGDLLAVTVSGNVVHSANLTGVADQGALRLHGQAGMVNVTCNAFDAGTGSHGIVVAPGSSWGHSGSVRHNRILGATSLVVELDDVVIGSNYYGGMAASVAGAGSTTLLLATELPTDPYGHPQCGTTTPALLTRLSGHEQAAAVGHVFADPLAVRVTDALGGAVPQASVGYVAPVSGASAVLTNTQVASDHDGRAATHATANLAAGTYEVAASAGSVAVGFELTNTTGVPAQMLVLAPKGGTQDGVAGRLVAVAPTVGVVDAEGSRLHGVPVLFQIATGDGQLGGASTLTGADGAAQLGSWRLGRHAGSNTVMATIPGSEVKSVTFSATGAEVADIGLNMSVAPEQAQSGDSVVFSIVANNAGPSHADTVLVVNALPAAFDPAKASWTCAAAGDASMCAQAAGNGDLDSGGSIGWQGSLTYTLTVPVHGDAVTGQAVSFAMAELLSGHDPEAGNDGASAVIEILDSPPMPDDVFGDGFEANEDSDARSGSPTFLTLTALGFRHPGRRRLPFRRQGRR